jgi:hypothetical protein
MVNKESNTGPQYRLYVILKSGKTICSRKTRKLASLQISGYRFLSPPRSQIEQWMKQTRLFEAAYLSWG